MDAGICRFNSHTSCWLSCVRVKHCYVFIVCMSCSLYTFDMRRLDQALCVHMDHVGAGNPYVL